MKEKPFESEGTERHFAYGKRDVLKMDCRCLYAGKMERVEEWEEKEHSHPFCEMLYVLSGEGEIEADGRVYSVTEGDVVVYNADVLHRERTWEKGLSLLFFGITDFKTASLPPDHLLDGGMSVVLHTAEEKESFLFLFRALCKEVSEARNYHARMAKYYARLILLSVLRLLDAAEANLETNAIFLKIHRYLDENFAEISCLDDVCRALSVSPYYLSHVFQKYMGRPPMQYVKGRRIAYAKRLLREGKLPASAIGEACGYSDRAVFFKAFKKAEGISPGEYRRTVCEK